MKQIINRKVYDTEKATVIASDRYWDGSNFERSGAIPTCIKPPKAITLHIIQPNGRGSGTASKP